MNRAARRSRQRGFLATIAITIPAMAIGSGLSLPATASVMTFTSSTAFNAVASGLTAETYATGTNGQAIANGGQFNTLTYNFSTGTQYSRHPSKVVSSPITSPALQRPQSRRSTKLRRRFLLRGQ